VDSLSTAGRDENSSARRESGSGRTREVCSQEGNAVAFVGLEGDSGARRLELVEQLPRSRSGHGFGFGFGDHRNTCPACDGDQVGDAGLRGCARESGDVFDHDERATTAG
jgi:hypothetical protein